MLRFYSVARGLHVSHGLCITGWKWVIEFLAPHWGGCHGNWQSPPARCVWLSSVFRFSSLLCYPHFSLFFVSLVIPTITSWLRSGLRLTGLGFRIPFQRILDTGITTENIRFILITDFIFWRINFFLYCEILLLPRCGFFRISRNMS
jgi:hypothetical protein